MKKLLSNIVLVIMFLFAGFSASASSLVYIQADGNTVLDSAEVAPSFPGGPEALEKWISKNLRYPNEERLSGVGGEVVVSFIVEKDGSIRMPKVEKGVSAALNNEAIRLVKSMPYWKAGKQGGKKVRVRSKVSVMFNKRIFARNRITGEEIALPEKYTKQLEQLEKKEKAKRAYTPMVIVYLPEIINDGTQKIDKKPSFPNGDSAFTMYMSNKIVYPSSAIKNQVQGSVVVEFTIVADGSVADVKVTNSVDQAIDKEVLRLVKAMPKWTPGTLEGNPVSVRFSVCIVFRLDGLSLPDKKPVVAQSTQPKNNEEKVNSEEDKGEIYQVVEQMPSFPGGNDALMQFLSNNLKYPEIAQDNGIQGRVMVQFTVNKDGSITDVEVIRGVDASLDAEAIRVVKSMPKWNPGLQRNMPVRVKYTMPIMFRLVEPQTNEKKPVAVQPKNNETKVDTLEKVYQIVERMPSFPGGDEALLKFVFDNMKYPEEAQDKGIQGRVMVHFTVGKDGSITDVEIFKGVHPLLDAEAIRVIKSMPKWIPGMKRDEPVSVRYTFPVMFRTEGPKAKKW